MELLTDILNFITEYKDGLPILWSIILGVAGLIWWLFHIYFKFRRANFKDNELEQQSKKELLSLFAKTYDLKKELLLNYSIVQYGKFNESIKELETDKTILETMILHDYPELHSNYIQYINYQMKWVENKNSTTVNVPKNMKKFEKIYKNIIKKIKIMERS